MKHKVFVLAQPGDVVRYKTAISSQYPVYGGPMLVVEVYDDGNFYPTLRAMQPNGSIVTDTASSFEVIPK